jgi:hypothetical protein
MRKQVLIFGLVGGVLVTLLQWTEFHFLVLEHSVAIYGVLIAILFAGAGIWLGTRLLAPRERIVEIPIPAALAPKLERDDKARERLGIMVKHAQDSGLQGAALDAKIAEAHHFEIQYANPLYRMSMTLLEPLPVGLVMALVSAGMLRRKSVDGLRGAASSEALAN